MDMSKISYIAESLFANTGIPVHCIIQTDSYPMICTGFDETSDPFLTDIELRMRWFIVDIKTAPPVLLLHNDGAAYCCFADQDSNYIVLGPVSLEAPTAETTENFKKLHSITSDSFRLPYIESARFHAGAALAYFMFTGKQYDWQGNTWAVTEKDVTDNFLAASFQRFILDTSEQEQIRFGYQYEREAFRAIREGTPEVIMERIKNNNQVSKPVKTVRDDFKHYEYLCCEILVLAVRAAIEGGLSSDVAYSLQGVGKQRLESCKTIPEIILLMRQTMIGIAACVQTAKEQNVQRSYIEKCRMYIGAHLNVPFTLEEMADSVGTNPSYMSRRFSQEMGMGIKKFTQSRRMDAAANLLKFSNTDISTIASYLCYPSQSHFGAVFKRHFGVTPLKYREREKIDDGQLF